MSGAPDIADWLLVLVCPPENPGFIRTVSDLAAIDFEEYAAGRRLTDFGVIFALLTTEPQWHSETLGRYPLLTRKQCGLCDDRPGGIRVPRFNVPDIWAHRCPLLGRFQGCRPHPIIILAYEVHPAESRPFSDPLND